ncbi:MAG TPA: 1-acyl-sn-glycerol-3-phosphate acyltransferase [Clostridiales bacterium UBA8960]|jgi:1-acyl-sn-glycerol-3-phosphate acyltransferase|nr:1-acyl-sn-glycerol-3-phosphate acyltransferase [Clostridiales bacterium UBA8960]
MFRTLIWFIYFWGMLILYLPCYYKAKNMKDQEQRRVYADEKARVWMGNLLKLAGCKVTVEGLENVPVDRAVLFVANHQSNFDIPLMITQLPGKKGFIAKIEMLKMPIVRDWMRFMNCVFMDRSDIRQQVKSISEGVAILKSGHSMVLFPEGTRSPDGSLLEFKAGGLKLATKSGVPIVPVTINHSKDLMKKGTIKITPAHVVIKISRPIEMTEEMNRETVKLTEDVKAIITDSLL